MQKLTRFYKNLTKINKALKIELYLLIFYSSRADEIS
jgi:hypothetical protein